MKEQKVSVVIPAHNEEKYIRKCLEALLHQTVKPYEIIVVDNNCTDKTAKTVETFPSVTLLHEHRQGIVPARDRGFDYATGDIIARCDADTIVYSDWIEKIQHIFNTRKVDAISGPADYYDLPKNETIRTLQIYVFFDIWKKFKKYDTMFGSNMALTKEMWKKIRGTTAKDDKHIHEDMDIAIQVVRHKGKTLFDDNLLVSVSSRRYTKKPASMPNYAYRWISGFLYESSLTNNKYESKLLATILKSYELDGQKSFRLIKQQKGKR